MLEAYKPMIELPYIFSKDGEVSNEFCNIPSEHLHQLIDRRELIKKTESKRETEESMADQPMDQLDVGSVVGPTPETSSTSSSSATMDWSALRKALENIARKREDD